MHRMTLRTGARDTKSVRTISLMERSCSKSARRISPILSTPIIPISPSQPTEAKGKDADTQRQRGSLLDAKIAPQGVIVASEFTAKEAGADQPRDELSVNAHVARPRPIVARRAPAPSSEGP